MKNDLLQRVGVGRLNAWVTGIPRKTVLIHLVVWIVYLAYESSILFILDNVYVNLWEVVLNFVLYAAIFYLNSLWVLPVLLKKKQYLLMLVNILVLIGLLVPVRYALYRYVLPHLDGNVLYPLKTYKVFLAHTVWRGGYFAMLSFGYFFANSAVASERQKRKMTESKRKRDRYLLKVEKDRMETEMTSLKNQINPHFLYNTLNFFYAQIYPHSQDTARGVVLLSEIMRYGLQEEETNGKVMLTKEVQHLQNYIAIHQLRFNHQLQIRFEIRGNLEYRMIIPLLLITFVENCFKHGDLFDPESPLFITIHVNDSRLLFLTRNKKKTGLKETSTGIGQLNIKRRLDLQCRGRYSLEMNDEEYFYTCKLILEL